MAIALDNSGSNFATGGSSSCTLSFSFVGSSNTLLYISVSSFSEFGANPDFASITIDGVAWNPLHFVDLTGLGVLAYAYDGYVVGKSGTVSIVATLTNAVNGTTGIILVEAVSYTEINQSSPIDSYTNGITNTNGASNTTSASSSTTVVDANSWLISNSRAFVDPSGFAGYAATGAATRIIPGIHMGDSNGIVGSSGSQTAGATWTNAHINFSSVLSIAPAASTDTLMSQICL